MGIAKQADKKNAVFKNSCFLIHPSTREAPLAIYRPGTGRKKLKSCTGYYGQCGIQPIRTKDSVGYRPPVLHNRWKFLQMQVQLQAE